MEMVAITCCSNETPLLLFNQYSLNGAALLVLKPHLFSLIQLGLRNFKLMMGGSLAPPTEELCH
jgi:hypothetical protein